MIAKIPNCITCLRIIGTFSMLFMKPYTSVFYITYVLCGLTDILDGWIARLTHSTSALGARLDSIADLSYYTVMAIKIFPELLSALPNIVWVIVWSTVALRILIYLLVGLRFHRFASSHTILNKFTGLIVFLLPFSLLFPNLTVPYGYLGACIAAVAAFYEFYVQFRPSSHNATAT